MLIKRLYRRLKWVLLYQWRSITLRQWPYESCRICGKAFRINWSVADEYWCKVVGVSDDGGGSLCIDCFLECADYIKIDIPISKIKIGIFKPEYGEKL